MSYTPISGGLSTALSGIVEPTKFLDIKDIRDVKTDEYSSRRIHSPEEKIRSVKYTILIVIISAIIFVTVIAIYDIIRALINNHYAELALTDPNSHNTPEDIQRTEIANTNSLLASIVFASVCVISAVILIFVLIYIIRIWR